MSFEIAEKMVEEKYKPKQPNDLIYTKYLELVDGPEDLTGPAAAERLIFKAFMVYTEISLVKKKVLHEQS
jgi:hypothetical protein